MAQRVEVTRVNGEVYRAYAKFGETTNGEAIAERGYQGLASELLGYQLAAALGANVPPVEVVLRRAGDTDDPSASRLTSWTWWCTAGACSLALV
jgi:hypothetical protein